MRVMRNPVVLAAVVAMTVGAAACGGSSGGGGNNAGTNPGTKPKASECPVDALAKATAPVNITFWHAMVRENESTLKKLTDQYNASQTKVKVTLVNQNSYDTNLQKYRSGLSTGALPDVLQIEDTGTQLMADSGGVVPVAACVAADKYDTSDFLPRVLQYYSIKNVLYAMPFNISNPILYYNKAAFRKAGLDPNKPPTTLDELKADSQKIVATGAAKYGIALHTDSWQVEQMLAEAGQPYLNNGNGRTSRATQLLLDNPAGHTLFDWFDSMNKAKLLLPTGSKDSDIDHYLAVGNLKAAMTIDTSAALGTIVALLGSGQFPGVEIAAGKLPAPAGQGGTLVGGAALYIMKHSSAEKQAAAWDYLKFLDDAKTQATWAIGTGYAPMRTSTATMPAMQQLWAKKPYFKVAYDQLTTGTENVASQGPAMGAYAAVRKAVTDALDLMYNGSLTPDAAIKQADTAADQALTDYNSSIGG